MIAGYVFRPIKLTRRNVELASFKLTCKKIASSSATLVYVDT